MYRKELNISPDPEVKVTVVDTSDISKKEVVVDNIINDFFQ
jgi:hypothetical protein